MSGTAIDTVPGALHTRCGLRRPAPAFRGVRRSRRVLAAALLAAACGGSGGADVDAVVVATLELEPGAEPAALVSWGDGRLVIGERLTGRIVAVDLEVPEQRTVLATVDVDPAADGQRGLLGLAPAGDVLYAAWTRASDDRLVVGQVHPGQERLIWEGPTAADMANGGHLAIDDDGSVLVGIGDLQQPERVDDPAAPNGKLLALDPDGDPDQRPPVRSLGWNNPFAFTVTANGEIWVADNAPGEAPERIGRGDGAEPPVEVPGRRAPAVLVPLGEGRLGLCGFLDGDLVEVRLGARPTIGGVLVDDVCRTGAATIGADLIALTDGESVRVVRLPPAT